MTVLLYLFLSLTIQNENPKWHSGENQNPSNPGQRCGAGMKVGNEDNWEWYSENCGATFPSLCVDGEPDRKWTPIPLEVDSRYPDSLGVLVLLFSYDVISLQPQR